MPETLGIDLGTTKSVGAIWRNGAPMIIPDAAGQPIITPSVVAIDPQTHEEVVGQPARDIQEQCPQAAVYSIKRLMGRRLGEDLIQEDLEKGHILYDVDQAPERDGGIQVGLGDKRLSPEQVSAKILGRVKQNAEMFLGHLVQAAVITVPAYFHESQREATRNAGRLALLTVKRVLNEPTAACLAFGYEKLKEERKTVAVYDLGGGTFDISIVHVDHGQFSVAAINGNRFLGGDDLDWMIVDWVLRRLKPHESSAVQGDVQAMARLRAAAERAKRALTTEPSAHLAVEGRLSAAADVHDLDEELTQQDLDNLARPWIQRTLVPCSRALDDAHLSVAQVQEVLLVGGQTRMPAVRRAVARFFQREPNVSQDPIHAVALGAAVQAAIIDGKVEGLELHNVLPLSLGVNLKGETNRLLTRNTGLPTSKKKIYSTDHENQESVKIEICQGEHPLFKDNVLLDTIELGGIQPAKAGEPQIEVEFHVDQDAILRVTATDKHTGNHRDVTIAKSVGLSDEKIATMIRQAAADTTEQLRLRLQNEARPLRKPLASALKAALATMPLVSAPAEDWSAYQSKVERLARRVRKADKSKPTRP